MITTDFECAIPKPMPHKFSKREPGDIPMIELEKYNRLLEGYTSTVESLSVALALINEKGLTNEYARRKIEVSNG